MIHLDVCWKKASKASHRSAWQNYGFSNLIENNIYDEKMFNKIKTKQNNMHIGKLIFEALFSV